MQFITFLLKKTRNLDQIAIKTVNFHTKCVFYVPNSKIFDQIVIKAVKLGPLWAPVGSDPSSLGRTHLKPKKWGGFAPLLYSSPSDPSPWGLADWGLSGTFWANLNHGAHGEHLARETKQELLDGAKRRPPPRGPKGPLGPGGALWPPPGAQRRSPPRGPQGPKRGPGGFLEAALSLGTLGGFWAS